MTFQSDFRDKTDFQNITKALEFINKLEPITYVYNFRDDYKDEEGNFDEEAYLAGTKKKTRRQSGFKAQDVYAKMIETYNDDNYADIVDYSKYNNPDCKTDKYWMAKDALIPFLVAAIQEQQTQIEELKQQINELKNN